jgi:hypothetical protein
MFVSAREMLRQQVRITVRIVRNFVRYFEYVFFWRIREHKVFSVFVGTKGLLQSQGYGYV